MAWFLIVYLWNGAHYGAALTTLGPFKSQHECATVEGQVHYHYSDDASYHVDTTCVSGAR